MRNREKVIHEFGNWCEAMADECPVICLHVLDLLEEQPEIIRCKDCKYYDHFNGCMSWHDVNSNNDNWYCADGERKDS